jgi:hypothetical protein
LQNAAHFSRPASEGERRRAASLLELVRLPDRSCADCPRVSVSASGCASVPWRHVVVVGARRGRRPRSGAMHGEASRLLRVVDATTQARIDGRRHELLLRSARFVAFPRRQHGRRRVASRARMRGRSTQHGARDLSRFAARRASARVRVQPVQPLGTAAPICRRARRRVQRNALRSRDPVTGLARGARFRSR